MAPGPPLGRWSVVTNLNNGLLNVEDFDPVTGTIQFNPTDTYNISGNWSDSARSLSFSYSFKALLGGLYVPISISFVGYIFEAAQPLFSETLGPTSAEGGVYLMAGTWHHSFSPQTLLNPWVAQSITYMPGGPYGALPREPSG